MKKIYIIPLTLAFVLILARLTSITFSQPSGVITLSFDDGWANNYHNAWAEMEQRGMRGCFNIVTVFPEYYESWPDPNPTRLTWEMIIELENQGNEIVSHSHNHPNFSGLSEAEIRFQCSESKRLLEEHGLTVHDFVYPGGGGASWIDAIVSEYYRTGRYSWGLMDLPYDGSWHVYGRTSYGYTDEEDLINYKAIIDEVALTGKWCILYFHSVPDIQTVKEQISRSAFAEVLDYILQKGVAVKTMSEVLAPEPPTEPTEYTLAVNVVGSGSVTRNPDQATYLENTEISLTAIPDEGWEFSGWSEDASGMESTITLIMDANKEVTATFEEEQLPPEPPTPEMTVEDWEAFWPWLKQRQAESHWDEYLTAMLELWKTENEIGSP